jgi:hypothetical protein
MKSPAIKRSAVLLLSILFIIPLGLLTKVYLGPGHNWVNHFLGGVFYEIFFCLMAAIFFPAARPWKIAGWVFLITALLEFLQLYHPVWLEWLRATWLGHLLIGSTFNMWDFPHYLFGCALGGIGIYLINRYVDH